MPGAGSGSGSEDIKRNKAQPLPFSCPQPGGGAGVKSPVAGDQCVFSRPRQQLIPSQEAGGRSPAWEGLLSQLGLGVPAGMASSTVAFSNGATVPGHVRYLSA